MNYSFCQLIGRYQQFSPCCVLENTFPLHRWSCLHVATGRWWLCVRSCCLFRSGLLVAYCHRFDILTQSSRIYFVACTVGTYPQLGSFLFFFLTSRNAEWWLRNYDKPSSKGINGRKGQVTGGGRGRIFKAAVRIPLAFSTGAGSESK